MSDRIKFCVAVDLFVMREGKILLGKRKGGFGAGKWGLPGGHLEEHETIEQAALRELKEETGLTARSADFVTVFNNNNREEPYVHFGCLAVDCVGDPTITEPNKFDAWQWFDLNNLPNEDIVWVHLPLIRAYKEKLSLVNHV